MDTVLVFILLIAVAYGQISFWVTRHPEVKAGYLWTLFGLHFLLMAVYVGYAFATVSDSFEYYRVSSESPEWFSLWGIGTAFINFLSWPFTRVLGLSYMSVMMIYSYLGFWAIALFYFAAREQLGRLPEVIGSYTWLELVWLLPNLHFWSSSLGKGSIALFSMALFAYGLSRYQRRPQYIFIGILMAYLLRPHIAFIMMGGTAIGILFTSRGVSWYVRLGIIFFAAIGALYFFQESTDFIAVKEGSVQSITDFIEKRAKGLTAAGSGLDYGNYNLAMKFFTFLFRPLFFDANGFMGFVVSFENACYLYMFLYLLRWGIPSFGRINGWYKAGLFVFLLGTLALAQISSNLGLAMRQKSQLMPFLFLIFLKMKEYAFEAEIAFAASVERRRLFRPRSTT